MQETQPSHLHSKSAGAAPSLRTHLHIHSESHTQVASITPVTADIGDPHMASYEMSRSTTPSTGKTEHIVSAEALTERLLKFKLEHSANTYLPLPQQQSNHHRHYPSDQSFSISSSPASSSSSFIAYSEEAATGSSRRSPQDTIQEILERIERRQHEKWLEHDLELEMELHTETLRRQRRLHLNPEMLKDHHHTLRQNHGNANLRHGGQES
ncbi:hypothetical protein BGZ68_002622 [Mortierella alpina]|nr:hypothetical protein BGZ68_002622 [Mortierella alpina]